MAMGCGGEYINSECTVMKVQPRATVETAARYHKEDIVIPMHEMSPLSKKQSYVYRGSIRREL